MSLTAIIRDFIVENGLIVLGNSNVTSSTNQTNALQVVGGAAIGKNLVVATTASIFGNLEGGNGGQLLISSELQVQKPTRFLDSVTFTGPATFVYSTNTVYTDNLIEIHSPFNSSTWTVDDGKDIGFRFHYYNAGDQNAALVFNHNTKLLEWYLTGSEGVDNFVGTEYGSMKFAGLILTSTATSTGIGSGALQVAGGASFEGNLFVGGTLTGNVSTASNLAGGAPGSIPYQSAPNQTTFLAIGTSSYILSSNGSQPVWQNVSTLVVDTARNLEGGQTGAIPFQEGVNDTGFDYSNFNYNSSTKLLTVLNLLINGTTQSTGTTSGALVVDGGVGIAKNLYVGGQAFVQDAEVITTATVNLYANQTVITAGTDTAVNTSTGNITIWNTSNLQSVTDRGNSTTNVLQILNSENSINTQSGALTVAGGAGIGLDLYVGGTIFATEARVVTTATLQGDIADASPTIAGKVFGVTNSSTQNVQLGYNAGVSITTGSNLIVIGNNAQPSNSTASNETTIGNNSITVARIFGDVKLPSITSSEGTNTGALVVSGGVGIAEDLYVGGQAFVNGAAILTTATVNEFANQTFITAGTDTAVNTSTGNITIWNTSNLQSVTDRGNSTTNAIVINNLTENTGTVQSNALYVAGGVGIGKSLYVTGEAVFANAVTFINTSTFIYSTNTVFTDNILELHNPGKGSSGLNNQWFLNDGKDIGVRFHYYDNQDRNGFLGRQNDTGYLTWYDRGAEGADTFAGARYGTFKTGSLILTDVTSATNTASGALQVAGGASVGGALWVTDLFVTGSSNVSSTGTVNIGNATATTIIISSTATIGELDVEGRVIFNSGLKVTTSTNSTSTVTGAIIVTGGVGIGRDVHVGGSLTVGGDNPETGTVVNAIYSNDVLLASYTSNVITTNSTQNLDQFSSAAYRTARYTVQIVDGSDVHVTELVLFHDGTTVFLNEYGVITNNGELGTFNASLAGGFIILTFTPNNATAMTIKVVRFTITA